MRISFAEYASGNRIFFLKSRSGVRFKITIFVVISLFIMFVLIVVERFIISKISIAHLKKKI